MILGTAAYMSPEQARGLVLDRRTDIWAFGCLLYEMLTARKPFEGETVSDSIAAILGNEADWTALPSVTPAAIERLLRRCLQKDRRHRLADAGDARLEIEEAQSSPSVRPSQGVALRPKALALQRRRQILRSALPMLLTLAVGTAVGVLATRAALRVDSSSVAWAPTFTRITN
jgi:serine/threonine protein kinase